MPQALFPDVINKLKLFDGLNTEQKGVLLREGRIRWCGQGQYLFHSGDPVSHFYIVCSGAMQLLRQTPDGDQITTDVVIAGKTISKTEIFRDAKNRHNVSAVAIEDAIVLEFSAAWLKKAAAESSAIALNILSAISQYAHMIQVEIEHKSTMTAAQQVACFLQRLCLMHDLDPDGFELPYSKTLIASRLGMEPETFSRTLVKLREHGIEVKDSWFRFHNMGQIGDYVCSHCSAVGECPTHRALVSETCVKKDLKA